MNQFLSATLLSAIACGNAVAAPVIGVFTAARQGVVALGQPGSGATDLRAAILSAYPTSTFREMATLTTPSLHGCDVVIFSSVYTGNDAFSPLTDAEQAALRAYMTSGGNALIFTDNDTFGGAASVPANNSLLAPFELTAGGTGSPWQQAATFDVSLPSGTAADGPFGNNAGFTVGWTGWFTNTAGHPGLDVLARLNQNGQPAMVQYDYGGLAAGSGRAVLFADTTMVGNGYLTAANSAAVCNALAYTLPPRCGAADIGRQGGLPGPDNLLNNNDFIVFIDLFFAPSAAADYGSVGGAPGPDGVLDNNDFIVFIDQFFGGCA